MMNGPAASPGSRRNLKRNLRFNAHQDAIFLCAWTFVLVLQILAQATPARATERPLPVLTTVRQVRALTSEQAQRAYPVRVQGVVTALSGWKNSFFLEDSTAGISVDRNDTSPDVRPGDRVEISGTTGPGLFAPVIIANRTRVLGRGRIPAARLFRFGDLFGGQEDSQWIQVRGVVHSAAVRESWGRQVLFLNIEIGGGTIAARVHDFLAVNPVQWVDATITARGVCGTNFNGRRQLTGLRLFVPSLDDIHVDQPAPSDPFAIPSRPLNSILQFQPGEISRHRVKVEGTVTYQEPGSALYLQDRGEALLVLTTDARPVPVGTRVEAVGFPAMGAYSPVLEDGIFRVIGRGSPPVPLDVEARDVIKKSSEGFTTTPFDGYLVRLRGRLIERLRRPGDQILIVVQEGNAVFYAHLDEPRGRDSLSNLRPGSTIEITGVCSIRTDENREPKGFWILLRSARDITVLKKPSWWSITHILWILALALAAILVATVWIAMLNRQVNRQTLKLREGEERFRAFMDNSPALAFMKDDRYRMVYTNKTLDRIMNLKAGMVLGKTDSEWLPEEAAHETRANDEEVLRTGKTLKLIETVPTPDGIRRRWLVVKFPVEEASGRRLIGGFALDLTERERAKAAARSSRERFRAVVETSNSPIISADSGGRITYWNPAAERAFGYTASEILGKPLTLIIPERYRAGHEQGFARYLATGEARVIGKEAVELAGLKKDGTEFPLELSLASWKTEEGMFFTGVINDITQRKRAEQMAALRAEERDREREEQLRLKDQFLSSVSHELRTPLAAIYWFTSNLTDGLVGEITGEQREHLALTLKNVAQLKKMIGDLLDVTRAGTGKLVIEPRETRLEALIAETLTTCQANAAEQGVTLCSEIEPGLPSAWTDPERVRQILINLIDNAIKFTPRDGIVTVRAARTEVNPDFVRVAVADTGCGIASENLQKIFERLYQDTANSQTSRKGLGLGLFISKDLVMRQGGEIWVESAPGQGATFFFTLPVFSAAAADSDRRPLNSQERRPEAAATIADVTIIK